MRTQINCPACQTQYAADVHQIVDVGRNPELKEALLAGYLNVAQCPSCGAVTQISGPLLYHDPEHELFMVHVPMEMGLAHEEQERMIGQLVTQTMDSLPPEERRGYMFQPETILSLQTMMEKVWGTEGVTPEMLARQRAQSELIQQMVIADKETVNQLIVNRGDEIDETFFAMLRAMRESVDGSGDEATSLKLTNLQARLYRETEVGRRLEKQQQALHEFNREAKQANGISPNLLLKHVLANRNDDSTLEALVIAGQQAFNYQFFLLLSERIEKRQKSGIDVSELVNLREHLLQIQQQIEESSKQALAEAQSTILKLVNAEDKVEAVRANLPRIDETVLYVLSASVNQAQEQGDVERASELLEIQTIISNQAEQQVPPEIRLINRLVTAKDLDEQQQILDENSDLIAPELIQVLKILAQDAGARGQEELKDSLQKISGLIEARLVS